MVINQATFSYPSRPNVTVARKVDLHLRPGQVTALVGTSGHGKTTIVHLLMRFYDTSSGTIHIDGVDLKELDVNWWHSNIGIVSQ